MLVDRDMRNGLPRGTVLNGIYTIESELGHGGFAIVYLARHRELDLVAIKEYLPSELVRRDGQSVHLMSTSSRDYFRDGMQRFLAEAKQMIKFRAHPSVVSCRDFFRANGTAYLVMDFEEGMPLSKLLRAREAEGRPFSETDLRAVIVPLLEGLAQVHSAGVFHRDIKPGNILIRREDERPVLIDFGAAKQQFAEKSRVLAPYTPGYAAIEQVGEGQLGAWTDLYAVGAMMWRMVAGGNPPYEPPNPVRVEKRTNAMVRGERDPMPSARELGAGRFSDKVLTAIDKCLELRESDRIQDCKELLRQIQEKEEKSEKDSNICPCCDARVIDGSQWCAKCRINLVNQKIGRLASPGKRLGAFALDQGALLVAIFVAIVCVGQSTTIGIEWQRWLVSFVGLSPLLAYVCWTLVLFARGTAFGKNILGIRVIQKGGGNATFITMLVRESVGKMISGLFLLLGFLWILFDRDSQAWHDKLMSTYVIE